MHTHITYGLALMLAFGAGTGFVGFRFGYSYANHKQRKVSAERQELRESAQNVVPIYPEIGDVDEETLRRAW